MDDFLFGLFGCVIVLGIFAVPIALFVVIFRRLGRVEGEAAQLRRELAQALAGLDARPPQASAEAPSPVAPPVAPVPAAERPSVETVVTTPTPAFFETKAVADPPPESAPAAERPREDRPLSVETVVSTPLPALFETRVSPPDPAAAGSAPAGPASAAPAAAPRPAKPSRSLEETLWTKLPVWIGAVALALAAAYLVKLSFERGWIGPALRVVLGVLFGVSLLGAGEGLRKSSDYVAKGLSAAGIAALFVSFFAATTLYQLIPAFLGFALMALTTATAVALSLRQGYIVAIVGLLGGFLTPALAGTAAADSSILFVYLLLLEIGLVVVSRRRAWASLPVLTLLGGLVWVFSRLGGAPSASDSTFVGIFLFCTTGLFLLGMRAAGRPVPAGAPFPADFRIPFGYLDALRWLAVGGALLAMSGLLSSRGYGALEWTFLGLIAGGAFVLARIDERYHGFAWLASGAVTFLLVAFAGQVTEDPSRAGAFLYTHLAFGALIAGGAFLAHFGSRYAGNFAALSSAAGVVYLLIQYFESARLGTAGLSWGAVALGLAIL